MLQAQATTAALQPLCARTTVYWLKQQPKTLEMGIPSCKTWYALWKHTGDANACKPLSSVHMHAFGPTELHKPSQFCDLQYGISSVQVMELESLMAVQGVHAVLPSKSPEESVLLHSSNQGSAHHSGNGHIVGPRMKFAVASQTSLSPAVPDVHAKVRPSQGLQSATAAVPAWAYTLGEVNSSPVAGSAEKAGVV